MFPFCRVCSRARGLLVHHRKQRLDIYFRMLQTCWDYVRLWGRNTEMNIWRIGPNDLLSIDIIMWIISHHPLYNTCTLIDKFAMRYSNESVKKHPEGSTCKSTWSYLLNRPYTHVIPPNKKYTWYIKVLRYYDVNIIPGVVIHFPVKHDGYE